MSSSESTEELLDVHGGVPEKKKAQANSKKVPLKTRRGDKSKTRKLQFRWVDEKDLFLVKEVQLVKPFQFYGREMVDKWKEIAEAVNKEYAADVAYIGVQRRFALILKDFKSDDLKKRYESGTEENVSEIKEKLAELNLLIEDAKNEEQKDTLSKQMKLQHEKVAAEEIRGAAETTFKRKRDTITEVSNPIKRTSDSTLVDLWERKQKLEEEKFSKQLQSDMDMKKQEFQLREKQMEFEKEKFQHQRKKEEEEIELQKRRFELDKEERRGQMETQKLMLELLLKKTN